jgi:hypothetical protein
MGFGNLKRNAFFSNKLKQIQKPKNAERNIGE